MNTAGTWQKDLAPVLQDSLIRHEAVDYGNIKLAVLRRGKRDEVGDLILRAHERQRLYVEKVSVVAHSFGGLSLGHTLKTRPLIPFDRIILFGCILAERFPWRMLHDRGQVGAVLNERTRSDFWATVAPFSGMPEAGWAGICGFEPCEGVVYERDYVWTRHSDLQYRAHYEGSWVPFFLGETPSESVPPRTAPTPWRQIRWLHSQIFRARPIEP